MLLRNRSKQDKVAKHVTDVIKAGQSGKTSNRSTCQAIWVRRILADLHQTQVVWSEIYCGNKATILMAKNPSFSAAIIC
ncbi:hypothetical protein MKW98_026791 [Papaver atlanticum]|uniref:Uncharacterized protein n=1 Tax=Papaver atlanticum TaxID=357466 RepID=A0AAD4S0B5_9MAGN|nr:hypothetical protein MKW98_026791 [Papaver atlanticum]